MMGWVLGDYHFVIFISTDKWIIFSKVDNERRLAMSNLSREARRPLLCIAAKSGSTNLPVFIVSSVWRQETWSFVYPQLPCLDGGAHRIDPGLGRLFGESVCFFSYLSHGSCLLSC
jgi:hypothetical protein